MTCAFRKAAVVLLLLLGFLSAGFATRRGVSVRVVTEKGEYVITAGENKAELSFADKLFGINYGRRAQKLARESKSNREILNTLFTGLTANLDLLCEDERVAPENAKAVFFPNRAQKFVYSEGRAGREIDKERLLADIVKGLGENKVSVSTVYRDILPTVTVDELVANTVRRGSFKTYYGYSGAARKENIERAVSHVNGATLAAGGVFSFNGTVGARTAARGYKEAPIIVNGKFEGGVGGGVCQVSTTLYNAVLYSDLAVLTVSRHSLPVRYVQPSFDAMVSSVSDFKFINDTDYPLYIEGDCKDGYVSFTVYGSPQEYGIRLISEKIKDIPRPVEYLDDDTLEVGTESVISEGADGLVSEGYLVRLKDGVEISRRKIRQDSYGTIKRTVLRGTADKAEISDNR